MIVSDVYSHNFGKEYITKYHSAEYEEIIGAIDSIDVQTVYTKETNENARDGTVFSPKALNENIRSCLDEWNPKRIKYGNRQFREIDAIKNRVGLEIQFGKYSFMAYDILLKLPIFKKRGLIDCGIEIVVASNMISSMSTGVGNFTQIVGDLEERGISNLDIPIMILGIDCTKEEWSEIGYSKLF